MNDLAIVPIADTLPGNLSVEEIDATMAYAEAEKAPATRAAYASDWRDFAVWCLARGAASLPAHQGLVAAYLSCPADAGRKASTIGRRAAAIADRHRRAGFDPPTNSEGVKATLRGIRRTIGTARQGKVTVQFMMRPPPSGRCRRWRAGRGRSLQRPPVIVSACHLPSRSMTMKQRSPGPVG
jgi:hypothetical protein